MKRRSKIVHMSEMFHELKYSFGTSIDFNIISYYVTEW
jgi:hypothetical protein